MKMRIEMVMPSICSIAKALTKYPQMDSPEHSPFCVALSKPFFEYLDDDPNDRESFAKAMQAAYTSENIETLASMYPWGEFKRGVVDVRAVYRYLSLNLTTLLLDWRWNRSFQCRYRPKVSEYKIPRQGFGGIGGKGQLLHPI